MNLLKYIEKNLVTQGKGIDETRRRVFLSFCIIISIPFIATFSISDLIHHNAVEGFAILFIVIWFVFNLFALKYVHDMKKIYHVSAFLFLLGLCYELIIGGGNGYAFLWFYFYPLAVFYILGTTAGVIWAGTSLVLGAIFIFWPLGHDYGTGTAIRFLITYSIVTVISFGLESSRRRYYQELTNEKIRLEEALDEVKTLKGLLPICSYCKRIRDDQGYWNQIEAYLHHHSEAEFSHGICPECARKHYPEFARDVASTDSKPLS